MIENRRNLRIRPSSHLHIPLYIGFPSVRQWKCTASLEVAILVTNPFLARCATCPGWRSIPGSRLPPTQQWTISICLPSSALSQFPRVVSQKVGLERDWSMDRRPNSKIPSIFDHRVRNPSTIESNYHDTQRERTKFGFRNIALSSSLWYIC